MRLTAHSKVNFERSRKPKPDKTFCFYGITISDLNAREWAGATHKICSFSPLPQGTFITVCDSVLSHYNHARYVGIQSGTFTQYEITKTATSSRKTKENIKPMSEEEAKKLYDLNIISFDYKKEYEDGKKNQFGLVAEDCDEVIPYAVYKPDDSEDSIWGIDYVKFVPYLIKNLQLHEQKINELEKEIEFLKHNRRT